MKLGEIRVDLRKGSFRLCVRSAFVGVVGDGGVEQRIAQVLVVGNRAKEALVRHISVVVAGDGIGRHDALLLAVGIVGFVFSVALLVVGIAPVKSLFHGKV